MVIETDTIPLTASADGAVLVSGTRVPLETIVHGFRDGLTAEQIVESFASLNLPDVYAVLAYYLRHRQQVDAYVAERDEHSEAARREGKVRFDQTSWRERLLSRLRPGH